MKEVSTFSTDKGVALLGYVESFLNQDVTY